MRTERSTRTARFTGHALLAVAVAASITVAMVGAVFVASEANAARPPELVTHCGQLVHRHGVLTQDLDCTAEVFAAVRLERRATLDLNGFSITGTAPASSDCWLSTCPGEADLVRCSVRCTVVGPGLLSGGRYGIVAASNLVDPSGAGTKRGRKINARNVTIANTVVAIEAWSGIARVQGLDAQSSGLGISARRIAVEDSQVTGSDIFGVRARSVRIRRSSLTGSGRSDVQTVQRPRIDEDSTCERSEKGHWGGISVVRQDPWGVCSSD